MKLIDKLKYSGYPWWYELTIGLVVDSKLYYYLYYKHTKKHKEELAHITKSILAHRKEIIGK